MCEHLAAGGGGAPPGPRVVRVAMWSGPRTASTTLMRAFENRSGTEVVDEPLYAYYLCRTGLGHPGRAEILASQPTDWRKVIEALTTGPPPPGVSVWYQKHMSHHLLPEVDREPLHALRHGFLIRNPAEVIASYVKVRQEPTLDDLGWPQQVELYRRFGGPVVDAADLVAAPEATLRALCSALDIRFDPAMLSWPSGPRASDGVWAPHWYANVWSSTGFRATSGEPVRLPERYRPLAEACRPYYAELAAHRLAPVTRPASGQAGSG